MARDRLSELMAFKERRGRRGGRIPSTYDIRLLKEAWTKSQSEDRNLLATLLPARIITFLEVFTKSWVQKLIDHGPPFADRAAALRPDKIEYSVALRLHGKIISPGLIISNGLGLSKLDDVANCFYILLGERDFFEWLSQIRTRSSYEDDDSPSDPEFIISDVRNVMTVLSRTFFIRNILVHELPENNPLGEEEIDGMLDASHVISPCSR
jgi:hypothetical protein